MVVLGDSERGVGAVVVWAGRWRGMLWVAERMSCARRGSGRVCDKA
jgi:hypothetical protein